MYSLRCKENDQTFTDTSLSSVFFTALFYRETFVCLPVCSTSWKFGKREVGGGMWNVEWFVSWIFCHARRCRSETEIKTSLAPPTKKKIMIIVGQNGEQTNPGRYFPRKSMMEKQDTAEEEATKVEARQFMADIVPPAAPEVVDSARPTCSSSGTPAYR